MTNSIRIFPCIAILVFALFPTLSVAEVKYTNKENTIGYPTVDAAFRALKARSDVTFRTSHGWTIADDTTKNTVWSFAPESHPAHPTVVKRQVVDSISGPVVNMRVLCQAKRPPCDAVVAQFEALNKQMIAYMQQVAREQKQAQSSGSSVGPPHDPTEAQERAAQKTRERFFGHIDTERFGEAYAMNTPGLKSLISQDDYTALQQKVFDRYGRGVGRIDLAAKWYNIPPPTKTPGIFVVYVMRCAFNEVRDCSEILTLHQQPDGAFRVARYERNIGLK